MKSISLPLALALSILVFPASADELAFDFTGDGSVTLQDANAAPSASGLDGVLQCIDVSPADIDGNGTVAFADFLVLSTNYNRSDRTFTSGDTNGDGKVDLVDFVRHSSLFSTANGYVALPQLPILDASEIGLSHTVENGNLELISARGVPTSLLALSVVSGSGGLKANGAGPFTITLLDTPAQVDVGNLGNPFVLSGGSQVGTEIAVTATEPLVVFWAVGTQIYASGLSIAPNHRRILNHHGRLAVGGVNHDGPGFFKAALVSGNPAVETLWSNDGTSLGNPGAEPSSAVQVAISKGLYSLGLGDRSLENMSQEVPASLFETNHDVFLRIWFATAAEGPFEELLPAQPITTSGYALYATRAEGVTTGAITNSMLANNAVDASKIAAGAVSSTKIAAGAITSAKIGPNSVTATAIAPDSIGPSEIDSSSVGLWEVSGGDVFRRTGKVGIGTTGSLNEELEIRAAAPSVRVAANDRQQSSLQLFEITGGRPFGYEILYDGFSDQLHLFSRGFSGNEDIRMTWEKDGKVGIGTTKPSQLLSVNGTAGKPGGGSWSTFSDARLKDVGEEFTRGLDELAQLRPVRYRYKKDNPVGLPSGGEEYVGFVAQDVLKAIPEAVEQPEGSEYLQINNDPILWTMLNAVKQLKAENERLRQRLDALEARLK